MLSCCFLLFSRPPDGTVHLRQRERIYFSYLITLKPTGAMAKVTVSAGAGMQRIEDQERKERKRMGVLGTRPPMSLHVRGCIGVAV